MITTAEQRFNTKPQKRTTPPSSSNKGPRRTLANLMDRSAETRRGKALVKPGGFDEELHRILNSQAEDWTPITALTAILSAERNQLINEVQVETRLRAYPNRYQVADGRARVRPTKRLKTPRRRA